MKNSAEVQAWIGDKAVSRDEVLRWEAKRSEVNLRKFGAAVPRGDAATLRRAVADAKLDLGREGVANRLAREVAVSDRVAAAASRMSGSRRRLSQMELFVPGATAEQLPGWYDDRLEVDDEAAMLNATPDHHLFRTVDNPRRQEVWETTGGSPVTTRFFCELGDTTGVVTAADPSFPVQFVASVRLASNQLIAGIRHQFRDENGGVRARLIVELPWLVGGFAANTHRWHLASEFTNWIETARDAS